MYAALPAILLLLTGSGCLRYGPFSPPEKPAHERERDGAMHVDGDETPYLCREADSGQLATCPWERPADALLSCDASGCHGDYDFGLGDPDYPRHLHGAAGPSCYACHDQVWSDKKER